MTSRLLTAIIFFNLLNSLILSAFGRCVSYTECRAAMKYLADVQTKKIHNSSTELLKKAYCGSSGRTPKVECEKIPFCYEPSDKNFCVKVNDCCPALRLIKQNATQIPDVRNKLKNYVCDPNAAEIEVKCSSLLELEENLIKQAANEDPCVTPSGMKGSCLIWEACPTFTGKPVTPNYQNYLAKSICDRKNKKVCCAPNDNVENICGVDNKDVQRIKGGTPTAKNEFPWAVILKYTDPYIVCGGTLINSQFVVTAGHCIKDNLRRIKIAGNFQDGGSKLEFRIISKELHPLYQEMPLKNDIALLRIETVIYQESIKWICLPTPNHVLPQEYILVGNGEIGNGSLSNEQLKATLPNLPTDVCLKIFENYFGSYPDLIICAGGSSADACKGDSGGPLQAKHGNSFWTLYGVVSGGSGNCTEGTPGLYTRVDKFVNWIHKTMKSMLSDNS